VWRGARYANPRVGMTVEALTDRDDKEANTSLEKEELLSHESFPPNDSEHHYELPPAGSAHTRVTEEVVGRALFSQSVKKAPRPDKLSFGTIRLFWKRDKERIVRLTRAAIRTGRLPAVWKRASGVVIGKPGKDDYTKVNAYRSISLLSCMGNMVEKVAMELLSEEAERMGLLSDGQFGSRSRRSTIDAAAIMVDRSHAAWTNGHITGVLLMDINAAFPNFGKKKTSQLDEGQGNGRRPYTMDGKLSFGGNGGDNNPGPHHGQTPSERRGPAGLTCVTEPLRDLHCRTNQVGRRVCIRGGGAILCRRPRMGDDRK